MNVDYLIDARTAWVARAVLADATQRDVAKRTMVHLGIPDAEGFALTMDGRSFVDPGEEAVLRSRMSAALGDVSARRSAANGRFIKDNALWGDDHLAVVDAVSATWLQGLGISVAEAYLLCSFNEDVRICRRNGRSIDGLPEILMLARDLVPTVLEVVRPLGRGHSWIGGTVCIPDGAHHPDTVRVRAEGRPLREVFSHPFLDGHDLKVVQWEDADSIVTDAPMVRVFPGVD